MPNLAHVVQQLRQERHQAQRRVEQLDEALTDRSWRATRNYHKTRPCSSFGPEMKNDVDCVTQTNCSRPAGALGKVESSTAEQIRALS